MWVCVAMDGFCFAFVLEISNGVGTFVDFIFIFLFFSIRNADNDFRGTWRVGLWRSVECCFYYGK